MLLWGIPVCEFTAAETTFCIEREILYHHMVMTQLKRVFIAVLPLPDTSGDLFGT